MIHINIYEYTLKKYVYINVYIYICTYINIFIYIHICNRLLLMVGLTGALQSNLYQNCSLEILILDWDYSFDHSKIIPKSQAKTQKLIVVTNISIGTENV